MRIVFVIGALFMLLLPACREDNNIVPLVDVDFSININEPAFFELTNITGWLYVTGGSRGILIYRNNIDQFTAYDRHSPFNVGENCQTSVLEDDFTVDDPCSESSWSLLDGSILSGPATWPLKQYNTQFDGTILRVRN